MVAQDGLDVDGRKGMRDVLEFAHERHPWVTVVRYGGVWEGYRVYVLGSDRMVYSGPPKFVLLDEDGMRWPTVSESYALIRHYDKFLDTRLDEIRIIDRKP